MKYILNISIIFLLFSCVATEKQVGKLSDDKDNESAQNNENPSEEENLVSNGNGRVRLIWDRPILNTDGSNIFDLKGFKIRIKKTGSSTDSLIDVGNQTEYETDELTTGKYQFEIMSYDLYGNQSAFASFGEVLVK